MPTTHLVYNVPRQASKDPLEHLSIDVFLEILKWLVEFDPPIPPRIRPTTPFKSVHRDDNGQLVMMSVIPEPPEPSPCLGWIRVTHVCSSWRIQTLQHKILWASNIGILPLAFDTILDRAGPTVPLTLNMALTETRPGFDEVSQRLVRCGSHFASRFSTIQVHLNDYSIEGSPSHETFRGALVAVADFPHVESIEIRSDQGNFSDAWAFLGRIPLTGNSHVNMPSLRRLCLQDFAIRLKTNTLVYLDLEFHTTHSATAFTYEAEEIVRSSCKTLEVISLKRNAILSRAAVPRKKPQPIALPNLRKLGIADSEGYIIYLLKVFSFPDTTSTSFTVQYDSDKLNADCDDILRAVFRKGHDFDGLYIHNDVYGSLYSEPSFLFDFYSSAQHHASNWIPSTAPDISLKICKHADSQWDPWEFLPSILIYVNGPPSALAVTFMRSQQSKTLAQSIFSRLPYVRHLVVFDIHMNDGPLDVLCSPFDLTVLLPRLETLCLATSKGNLSLYTQKISCWKLFSQIKSRARMLTDLKTLRVERSFAPLEDATVEQLTVASLRKLVPNVEWRV